MFKSIYYYFKPLIPRKFQIYVRSKSIKSNMDESKDIWPILKGSEKKPDNWCGWPDGKEFALVITHDVEHQRGYDRVLNLMEVEKELGFVSSFYFVPERDYIVERELLNSLIENGFEYGVHGLYHDGKLFSTEEEFLKRAKKINHYLKDWNTVGFRAPAMHHNLDLIGALDIEYDLSTFDTDPFEPQNDGVGTIFPFWVENKRNKNGGYIEIPYTLPQDFLLFILMKEKTINIWKKKIDWIVQNNGLVQFDVHPDYLNFSGKGNKLEEFSIEIYIELLSYIKDKYNNQYWLTLPNNLAKFWKEKIESK